MPEDLPILTRRTREILDSSGSLNNVNTSSDLFGKDSTSVTVWYSGIDWTIYGFGPSASQFARDLNDPFLKSMRFKSDCRGRPYTELAESVFDVKMPEVRVLKQIKEWRRILESKRK